MGFVDLHDYGSWEDHHLDPGDQIIGIYGLHNQLIRGIGFIMLNLRPSISFLEKLKRTVSCAHDDATITEPRPQGNAADEPNIGECDMDVEGGDVERST